MNPRPYFPVPDIKEFGGVTGVACRIQKERHEGHSDVGQGTMGSMANNDVYANSRVKEIVQSRRPELTARAVACVEGEKTQCKVMGDKAVAVSECTRGSMSATVCENWTLFRDH